MKKSLEKFEIDTSLPTFELAKQVMEAKEEVRELQGHIRSAEWDLVRGIADDGHYDCLSINYSRLRQFYK